ncbi:hypothetical protein FS837_003634 [Tulasnella sp. UAMH 9824]|nr:hypothetical protein FS837_003634 [Tulasnella sp. UAMH 9824]
MKEEDAGDMRWVAFLTLVDNEGGRYRPRSSIQAAYGGFSDIWQCDARFFNGWNVVVAVKKLRAAKLPPGLSKSDTTKKLLGRLKKELQVWMRLQHPNVVPLLGFTFDEEIAIISPWFGHGNVSDYLLQHPDTDRMQLVQGVASGLLYLHSSAPVVVHGDIKPDNVLIDQFGCPRIIDFGLSKLVEEEPGLSSLNSASLRDAGNARWIAPELLLTEDVSRSCRTDIFSWGCVAFFILTGDVPFKGTLDRQLPIARFNHANPIPDGALYPVLDSNSTLMNLLRSCWNENPEVRPEMSDIVKALDPCQPKASTDLQEFSGAAMGIGPERRLKRFSGGKFWATVREFWRKLFTSKGRRM